MLKDSAKDLAVISAAILGLHLAIMQHFPIIYGGDPVPRLVNFPKILLGHQLPQLQILIHFTMRGFYGPLGIWALMGVVSAFACTGLYALTSTISQDRRAARVAALLYFSHPFILYYSLVPYQESLLLAGTAWGFYFLLQPTSRRNLLLSSILLGVACLTRYEGWIAAATAALYFLLQTKNAAGRIPFKAWLVVLALFGWAPTLWVVWNHGLSPDGTYVLDLEFQWARLYRPYFVAKTVLWWTESAVVLMALVGFPVIFANARMHQEKHLQLILGFLALFAMALIFSGHAIQPDPTRLVTEREAYVPICFLIIYAGVGGSELLGHLQRLLAATAFLRQGIPLLALLLIAAYSLNRGIHRVAAANSDPELKTEYEVATFFVKRNATALILAAPLPEYPVQEYLRYVEKARGQVGKKKAEQLLKEVETTPIDYQRVLMFSWLGKGKILSADLLKGMDRSGIEAFFKNRYVEYLVVFADLTPVEEHERIIISMFTHDRSPEAEIRNGHKAALIYRIGT